MKRFVAIALALAGCGSDDAGRSPMTLLAVSPASITARGGVVTVTGRGFEEGLRGFVRDVEVEVRFVDGGTVQLVVPGQRAGDAPLRLELGDDSVGSDDALRIEPLPLVFAPAEAWRLPQLEGARGLAATVGGFLVGTSKGLAKVRYDAGTFVASLAAPPEGETAWEIGSFATAGDDAIVCSADGTRLGWSTKISEGYTTPLVVPMEDGARCLGVVGASAGVLVSSVNSGTYALRPLRVEGDGPVFGALLAPTLDGPPDVVRATDLDADGFEDLLVGGPFGLRWWRATGAVDGVTRLEDQSSFPGRTARTFAVLPTDADGDGHLDVLASGAGQDALFVNDGFGRFFDDAFRLLPFERATGRALAAGDLDLDGHDDLVTGSDDGPDRLFIASGSGYCDETPALGLGDAARTRALLLLDLDSDGDLDVVTADADGRLHVRFLVEPAEEP